MTAFTITKIICPCCEGSGICDLFSGTWGQLPCMWCAGAKRLPVAEALRFAEQTYSIGVGGYICGDHDKTDADRMTADAEAIYAMAGQRPSWWRASA